MQLRHSELGQASAELVAVVPLLLVLALGLAQLVAAGWALLSAGEAARAGARAAHVGADPEVAVRRTLPAPLEPAGVSREGEAVRVRVQAPGLIPGAPPIRVTSAAALDPAAGTR